VSEERHVSSLAARRRLMGTGYVLGLIGVVLFAATFVGYKQWRNAGTDAETIASLAREAAEEAEADQHLPRELRTLAGQADEVVAGKHPFAAPPIEELEPVEGPDGKLIHPGDPRYEMVAGLKKDDDQKETGQAAGDPDEQDDLSKMTPEAALARVTMSMAGRLQSYAGWLDQAATESEERLAAREEAAATEQPDGEESEGSGADAESSPAGDGGEQDAEEEEHEEAAVVRERIADYRARAAALSRCGAPPGAARRGQRE